MIPYLLAQGHKVLNLDLVPFPDPSADVFTLKTDLTDSGQVFNALTTHFNMTGYSSGPVPGPPDVVIHFAGLNPYNSRGALWLDTHTDLLGSLREKHART